MRLKILIICTLLIILPSFSFASADPPFTYEIGITFGMSLNDVMKESVQDFHKGSKTELICDTLLCDIDLSMALSFGKKDKLYEILLWFETDGLKPKYCVSDFEEITEYVTSLYGDPHMSGQKWKSKTAAEKYQNDFATALENKAVVLMDCWDFTDVYISHYLMKTTDNKIQHFLNFYSPILHPDIKDIKSRFGYE